MKKSFMSARVKARRGDSLRSERLIYIKDRQKIKNTFNEEKK